MELKLFAFIEDVLQTLMDMKPELEKISGQIEDYFENFLRETNRSYISIDSRVKSSSSLKEKIIRNHYYQKYDTKEKLFDNLPDVIGIRLGCKFIEDENDIYKGIRKWFNEKSEAYPGYFYNNTNVNVLLKLKDKQPQEQKNGMKIYRIDGKFITETSCINFEMQIKALVNIFWSEIEHKIIYKNYNYVIADKFYKDIMKSIKNSLTTIDQQLLIISNQFNQNSTREADSKEEQVEKLVSKMIYDVFAERMQESLGILIDFRKSCETVVHYIFRNVISGDIESYNNNLMIGVNKFNRIEQKDIDFKEKLVLERKPEFKDVYSKMIGEHILECINDEFQWNLFFRILFTVETDDDTWDFQEFIHYYTSSIYNKISMNKLSANFTDQETKCILNELMTQFAQSFIHINSVELLYDNMALQSRKIISSIIDAIYKNIITFEQWESEKDIYLELLDARMLMLFNIDIDAERVLAFLNRVQKTKSNVEVPKGMLKGIYKL